MLLAACASKPAAPAAARTRPTPQVPVPKDTSPDPAVAIAMVALEGPRLATADALAAELQARFSLSATTTPSDDPSTIVLEVEGAMILIGLMGAPIPWGDLEWPAAHAIFWPDAAKALHGHRAHVIVAIMKGPVAPVARHLLLTRAVAAVVATTPAVGVYWSPAPAVVAPQFFLEVAAEASLESPPLLLWLSFQGEQAADGPRSLGTAGMGEFGQMNLLVSARGMAAEDMLELLLDAAGYLLANGAVLKDGDTFGHSATERIAISYVPAPWDANETVIRLSP